MKRSSIISLFEKELSTITFSRTCKQNAVMALKAALEKVPYWKFTPEELQEDREDILEEILYDFSKVVGISPVSIKSHNRVEDHVFSRMLFIFYVRSAFGRKFSLQRIGVFLNGRDHASILHAMNKAKELLELPEENKTFLKMYTKVRNLRYQKDKAPKVKTIIRRNTIIPNFSAEKKIHIDRKAMTVYSNKNSVYPQLAS